MWAPPNFFYRVDTRAESGFPFLYGASAAAARSAAEEQSRAAAAARAGSEAKASALRVAEQFSAAEARRKAAREALVLFSHVPVSGAGTAASGGGAGGATNPPRPLPDLLNPPSTIRAPVIKLAPQQGFAFSTGLYTMLPEGGGKNSMLVDGLTELLEQAESVKNDTDAFRVQNYRKAIAFIKKLDVQVTSVEHLEELLADRTYNPGGTSCGFGNATKTKVTELLQTGTTSRALARQESEYENAVRDLQRVWGIGIATAKKLIETDKIMGVSDLRAKLGTMCGDFTRSSNISDDSRYCLDRLDDLETRIPRDEVEAIAAHVRRTAELIWGSGAIIAIVAGSYRRGKTTCGDVDVLLTHRDNPVEDLDLSLLIRRLEAEKFILRVLKAPVNNDEERGGPGRREAGEGTGRAAAAGDSDDSDVSARGADPVAEQFTADRFVEYEPASQKMRQVISVVSASYAGASGVTYSAAKRDVKPVLMPRDTDYYSSLKKSVMTVCKLAPEARHRRLDIKYYPRAVFPFALLYFTGSDFFNRSLRLYVKNQGWSLSDHGLTFTHRLPGRKAEREKEWEGHSVACSNEADVLRAIGVPWREPHERGLDA